MLNSVSIPGLFITATDTEVGKTVITGAIAAWFKRRGARVGVCKPIATGCEKRREGLVSTDAEFLAHCADSSFSLEVICPQRYLEPLAPAVAAQRAGEPVDWTVVQRSLDRISRESDLILVEGIGGVRVPLDEKNTVRELASWLKLPTIVVARAGLGTINHTLLTLDALRSAKVDVAGVVINQYPAENPTVAEETNVRVIEKFGKVPVLCVVPAEPFTPPNLPPGVVAAIDAVDWAALT